jgi:transposase InsO family protein
MPVRDQEASSVAKAFVVSIFGVPLELHTDQGSNFESALFKEMCDILGIQKTRTTSLHPQSDGMVKRGNRTISHMLSSFVSDNQRDWDERINLLMLAYRSSVHETTNVTPNEMMFSRQVTLPIELMYGKPAPNEEIHNCSQE